MPEPDRLQQILDFLWTIDQMKTIYRSSPLHDHSRHENDAEHSWHMAMYCLLLGRELQVDCDLGRVLEMVLCHDLVEILAGDVNLYDTAARAAQQAREEAAAAELFGQLPAPLGEFVDAAWREFEAGQTPEARFARAMDRLQAIAQNARTGGEPWRARGLTEAVSREVNGPAIDACPSTREAFDRIWSLARDQGLFSPEPDPDGA